ncbi:MAG: secondary thiamine-phosphate synthase enzyme YjbQ [Candidatus Eisenbacteria bacterium]|nr:secondary thiamine-phosphate synthase enzyme YjbQ [Candidatus Eisenbacteria bacterium]
MIQEIAVSTCARVEVVDISSDVRSVVRKSGVKDGICCMCVPHTTAGITVNEGADPSVTKDLLRELNAIVPFEHGYSHAEGNSAAHIKSTLVGASETVFVENGDLKLGTWQSIFFCEFDGPRRRRVMVKVIPG